MKAKSLTIVSLLVGFVATGANAALVTIPGALTTSSPTFNRPLAGSPPSGLSAVGTAVYYTPITFTVDIGGSYTFDETGLSDGFAVLYSPTFSPASPLTNAIVADDDTGPGSDPTFTTTLTAGTSYTYIATAFGNGVTGSYTVSINGPGTATVVPEPMSFALLAPIAFAFARRRRSVA